MSIKTFFKNMFKRQPTIRFKSIEGAFNIGTYVKEAKRVIPDYVKSQVKNHKENRFARCPGMFDLAQAGYLIVAHRDIHIKANKQGVIIKVDNMPSHFTPVQMDYSIVEGLAHIDPSVKVNVWKVPCPWGVFCKKGYSAHVLPATLHSQFLDKMYVYPGTVDYDKFPNINFIFTIIKECEFTIWAGTPILQVIPYRRENITAECGKANENELDIFRHIFFSRMKNFYRKMFHVKKSYTIEQV